MSIYIYIYIGLYYIHILHMSHISHHICIHYVLHIYSYMYLIDVFVFDIFD